MDLRQLRYFLGIVEHGSLSAAAQALRVAQPALSLHLRRLEDELGCPLVLRSARGVVPTESGRRLAERAASLVEAFGALKDEVRGLEAAPAGPVAVGIPTSLGTTLTVPLARAVLRDFPGIHLRVVEALSGHMLEWVSSGEVDMALVFGTDFPKGLSTRFVAGERLALVAAPGHPLGGAAGAVALADVLDQDLILPGRPHGLRAEVEKAALSLGRVPRVAVEIDAMDHVKALVAEGIGCGVMSERLALLGPESGRLTVRPITDPEIRRTISLAHSARRPLSIAARAVQGLLLEQLGLDRAVR